MKLFPFLLLLALAPAALPGEMLTPSCGACGWTGLEIFFGRGPDDLEPVGLVYMARHGYAEVEFDPLLIISSRLGFEVPPRGGRRTLEESVPGIRELLAEWSPPARLRTDRTGPGVTVSAMSDRDRMLPQTLLLVERPWEGLHRCPRCGGTTVTFDLTGEWD